MQSATEEPTLHPSAWGLSVPKLLLLSVAAFIFMLKPPKTEQVIIAYKGETFG